MVEAKDFSADASPLEGTRSSVDSILPYTDKIFQMFGFFFPWKSIPYLKLSFIKLHVYVIIGYIKSKWQISPIHDDVIKWKHFPRYWPFVQGIPRLPLNSPHKGQRRAHYDVIVMHSVIGNHLASNVI